MVGNLYAGDVQPISQNELKPLQTVNEVNVKQYMGKWHEIARLPNSFQKGCINTTATYTLLEDGDVQVINECTIQSTGKKSIAEGLAKLADTKTNSKLKVTFLPGWLRWTGIGVGDYWIIALDDNYKYAVVSEPNRKYLWILSRDPVIDNKQLDEILIKIKNMQFDLSDIIIDPKNKQ